MANAIQPNDLTEKNAAAGGQSRAAEGRAQSASKTLDGTTARRIINSGRWA